jgi:DNA-binding transcriptional LysR family regulator
MIASEAERTHRLQATEQGKYLGSNARAVLQDAQQGVDDGFLDTRALGGQVLHDRGAALHGQ